MMDEYEWYKPVTDRPATKSTVRRWGLAWVATIAVSSALCLPVSGCEPALNNIYAYSPPCEGTQDTSTLMGPAEAQEYVDAHGEDPDTVCFTGVRNSSTWYITNS